jgi:hypothetical protein
VIKINNHFALADLRIRVEWDSFVCVLILRITNNVLASITEVLGSETGSYISVVLSILLFEWRKKTFLCLTLWEYEYNVCNTRRTAAIFSIPMVSCSHTLSYVPRQGSFPATGNDEYPVFCGSHVPKIQPSSINKSPAPVSKALAASVLTGFRHANMRSIVWCQMRWTGQLAVAQTVPWLRRLVAGLSVRRPGSVHVEFVVDKVALGQVFLRVLRFSPVNIILLWLSILIYNLGVNNRPIGGRSSETISPHWHEQQ